MHYFWRGDMQHFSPPLPFQRGRAECSRVLARDLGGPDRGGPRVPGCGSPPTTAAGGSLTSGACAGRPRVPGSGGPLTPAAGAPSTSAGQSGAPARAGLRWSPDPRGRHAVDLGRPDTLADGGQPGTARAAPVRRGVTAAISNWPAAPAAGQPKQVRAPVAGGLAPFSHYF